MAREPGRLGCARESRDRDEPMLGTASRVRRWLLVEQPGPWGSEALLDSRLDGAVAESLDARAREHNVRVLLVRRRDAGAQGPRQVFLARTDRAHRWLERLEIADPAQLTSLDLAALGADEPPGIGEPWPDTLALVCTNGKHDPCCADLGRPVVRALRAAGVDAWESSHVGGDRFAANVVCLPTGVYFGRVPPNEAARILADHDRGVLHLQHYRGRSAYSPVMQAAEIFARRALEERRLDALRFVGAVERGGVAAVRLLHSDGRELEVRVARVRGPAEALTCADLRESRPWQQQLLSIENVPRTT